MKCRFPRFGLPAPFGLRNPDVPPVKIAPDGGQAARESVTIAGRPERVAVARPFAAAVLGRRHPHGETAVLLLSELVTNSVRHSGSGLPGQTVRE
jgi:hypothetical protein